MASQLANSFHGLGGDSPMDYIDEDDFPIIAGPGFSPDTAEFSPELMAEASEGGYAAEDAPIMSPAAELGCEEGVALREWRRNNAIRLEEKERIEKEIMSQIVAAAEDFKVEFHARREVNCETNKVANREKEMILVASLEKAHSEADKNYWKTIAELIPNEVPAIGKKKERKGEEKKPSIAVVQGPKPGKPTELSRMRHILLKLKHETPSHLELSPAPGPIKDCKAGGGVGVSTI